ncbi:uncharacterized protein Gasu_30870 [Galdieria sulphuraria]|uniref:Restriction endonuclease type IV Mrr domain-containing protein n=1 Tax=Galdieria sulphuraria TaxID=130081 RepID=M2Y0J9_GALSU|nr:uncharacterized protein Gasu_30870 [Galdieria sulphuraria]EME29443.1 hypothetical protein Gasu_30870 [Galdieria sulphuraria]|eukprot:XP_005705963.1 hypothetical protein Gasu_30870 [Galdieria sulphuraria]
MFSLRYLSSTAVSKGRAFERTVLLYLSYYGFLLRNTGGAGDGGIDFRGTWKPNDTQKPITVVGQCKALSERVGVHVIRELEGTLCREEPGCLGVIVSEKGQINISLLPRSILKLFDKVFRCFHPLLEGKISEFWYSNLVRSLVPNLRVGFSFAKKESNVIRIVHFIDTELRSSRV